MDRAFGLLLLVVYVAAVVGLSCAVTYIVIKLFPVKSEPKKPAPPSDDGGGGSGSSSGGGGGPAGRLFRKAKREAA